MSDAPVIAPPRLVQPSARQVLPAVLLYADAQVDADAAAPSALTRVLRWTFLIVVLPAAVAPFVPFAFDTSPLDVADGLMRTLWSRPSELRMNGNVAFALLGLPFFLGPLIVVASFVRIVRPRVTRVERVVGWSGAVVSGLMTITICMFGLLHETWSLPRILDEWQPLALFVGTPVLLALPAARVALRSRAARMNDRGRSSAFIAVSAAYLANGVMCLVGFDESHDIGWWLTLIPASAIAVEHVAAIASGTWRWFKSRRSASAALVR